MERLPTELLDHIVSCIQDDPEVLTTLRLVNKAFARSAARELFRSVPLRLSCTQSFENFEAISLSNFACHVRELSFSAEYCFFKHEQHQFALMEDGNADRLPSLISNFVNVNTIYLMSPDEDFEPAITWMPTVLEAVAKPQLCRLRELTLPTEGSVYLAHCLESDHHTEVQRLIRQIHHLWLNSSIDFSEYEWHLEGLDLLLRTAINLSSLDISGDCLAYTEPVKDICSSPPLQLRVLKLRELSISSFELLSLLERCKNTLREVELNRLILVGGSWLHVLTQTRKNLELLDFSLADWYKLRKNRRYRDDWLEFGSFRRDYRRNFLALGDLERQINANRLAQGLPRRSKKDFKALTFKPLKSIMDKDQYTELISRSWDAEKDDS